MLKTSRLAGAALLVAAATAALPAGAQSRSCGDRDRIVAILAERYGETVRSMGLAANASIFEVFASDETGSWTITMTTPDGQTCLMASGLAFDALAAAPAIASEDA